MSAPDESSDDEVLSRSDGDGQEVDGEEEEGWDDWEAEGDEPTQCLLSSREGRNVLEALEMDRAEHGFDLFGVVKQEGLDFYGAIRLVNFIRTLVRAGQQVSCRPLCRHGSNDAALEFCSGICP
jgi:protein arginine N-methyltransferase 3